MPPTSQRISTKLVLIWNFNSVRSKSQRQESSTGGSLKISHLNMHPPSSGCLDVGQLAICQPYNQLLKWTARTNFRTREGFDQRLPRIQVHNSICTRSSTPKARPLFFQFWVDFTPPVQRSEDEHLPTCWLAFISPPISSWFANWTRRSFNYQHEGQMGRDFWRLIAVNFSWR